MKVMEWLLDRELILFSQQINKILWVVEIYFSSLMMSIKPKYRRKMFNITKVINKKKWQNQNLTSMRCNNFKKEQKLLNNKTPQCVKAYYCFSKKNVHHCSLLWYFNKKWRVKNLDFQKQKREIKNLKEKIRNWEMPKMSNQWK